MRRPWWFVVVLGGLIAAAPAGSGDNAGLEGNARLLEKWKGEPKHYQRLRDDLRAFYSLPAGEQDRLRGVDRELHAKDAATQARLWAVLDRYAAWLDRLPADDRARVLGEKDPDQRVKLIRALRQKEWLARLPAQTRAELQNLPEVRRAARIAELRKQQQAERRYWLSGPGALRAARELWPERLDDLPAAVREFLRKTRFVERLNGDEKRQLAEAEGKWPDLVLTVRALSAKHPWLPPGRHGEITDRRQLRDRPPTTPSMKDAEGKWPEYALAVAAAPRRGPPKEPLGACKLEEFPPEARAFIRDRLLPALDSQQRQAAQALEGRWPDYPLRLLALAHAKDLPIPGMSLPGPRTLWEASHAALPNIPGHVLEDFALRSMSKDQRAGIQFPLPDRASKERMTRAFMEFTRRKGTHGKRGR
jgi:hypothetical protein